MKMRKLVLEKLTDFPKVPEETNKDSKAGHLTPSRRSSHSASIRTELLSFV